MSHIEPQGVPQGKGAPQIPQPPVQPPGHPPIQAPVQPQYPAHSQYPAQQQFPAQAMRPRGNERQPTRRPIGPTGAPGGQGGVGGPAGTAGRGPRRAQKAAGSTRLNQALASARAWARPASTGTRLLAFGVDVFVVAVAAAIVWVATSSALLGSLTVLEAAVLLAIIEARTGVTVGNWLLRIRTVRDDSPYSPGIARGAVRALVLGAGCLFAVIGGFVVVATSAADPMHMGRSWADRAGRTLVVRVPTNAERAAWEQGAEAWTANALVAQEQAAQPQAKPQAQPQLQRPVLQPPQAPVDPHQLRPVPVQQASGEPREAGTTPPRDGLPTGVVPVEAPVAAPPPVRQVVVGEQVLLTFDTGQRVQLPLPLALNLGRKPEPSEESDQLCVVNDPDSSVSKTHLRLECKGESVWLTDLGSTNGSAMLDDTGEALPLAAGSRVRLEEGYRVKLGNRSFTVTTVIGEMQV